MTKIISLSALTAFALLSLTALSGCVDDTTPLPQRSPLIDMGSMPVPGKPYVVHGYRLDNGTSHDHYLYFAEDQDGQLLSGVMANATVSSGKSSHAEAVQTEVPQIVAQPEGQAALSLNLKLSCDSVEQCQRKLAALHDTQ